jgi:cobalamin biosynthesis protein CobT
MRRLLQVRAAKHYSHGHKQGKLAASRLWRVGLPPIDGGDWNSRVFKKRTAETDLLNTAILILTDGSGSMSGEKFATTARAAGLCNDAFANVLHIPLAVVCFTSSGATPVLGIMKDFNERVSDDQMAERYYDFAAHMAGNNDADSLLWAYHHILTRPEKRKLIIVLSDGSPADGIGDPYYALKQVTEQILKEGRVDLYGIGIMDTNVTAFYPKNRVIKSISELESALVDVMGKALT